MAPDDKSSNGCEAHAWYMGLEDELKKGPQAQPSARKGKDKLLCPRGTETTKYPDKLKAENYFAQPLINQSNLGKATAADELVKHMSNLPAYLQRIKKGDNIPEKVLNVGVLDWTCLEKWKVNQKAGVKIGGSVSSSSTTTNKPSNVMSGSSSLPDALPMKSSVGRSVARDPLNSFSSSFDEDGLGRNQKPARSKVGRIKDSVSGSKVYLDIDRKIISENNYSGKNCVQVTINEGVKNHEFSQEYDLTAVKSSGLVKEATEPFKSGPRTGDQHGTFFSETGASSFSKIERPGEEVDPSDSELVEKVGESDLEVSHQPCHRKQKSTALLLPKGFPQKSIPDLLNRNERRVPSAPCLVEVHGNILSDSTSSVDLHSGVIFSEIPRSCQLPSQHETQSKTLFPTPVQASDELSTSESGIQGFPSFKCAKREGSRSKATSLDLTAELKLENRESPEPDAPRSRHPSPNGRFSFSLGHLARSYSFKETIYAPKMCPTYVSAKSGPISSRGPLCGDTTNQERASPLTRGRSSPLRRLLDPLLKPKSRSSHYAENIQPLKTVNATGPLLWEKHSNFTVQALLQLTIKDGKTLFKFVVDKNSNVLAAAVSNSISAQRCDSFRSCTFYSVNEIKKKGIGWIQGNKAKEGGFACSIVGQMKLAHYSSDSTSKRLDEQVITTECVLYGADSTETNKNPADSIPPGELAAIVLRFSPNENSDHNSVTVILPGGVHGLPDEGEPSSLIDRWVSGGMCDCGGWDVGCEFHVFSNKYCPKKPKTRSSFDHLQLFSENKVPSDKPVFSMTPFRKGIYSIELDSSISLLQAFSICVAFLSCRGQLGTPEASCLPGENKLQESSLSRSGTLKDQVAFQREGSTKYAPCPPLSPVGRV
ncbi:hypothetical protein SAY87_009183 [Trapa incisa]|uniref:Uncharacterized protein n=1 Tax=Trapa incisa TaxID=236973 RepID=A0AAN7JXD6_9MYRT|nr:hypothetical protein SAY87_009183 [Trapa incisa]